MSENDNNEFSKKDVMNMMNCPMGSNFSFNYTSGGAGASAGTFTTTTSYGNASTSGASVTYNTAGGATGGAYSGTGIALGSEGSAGITNAVYHPFTGWDYYQNWYYPLVIRESYPVYIQEKALDKGKQAFEILKTLQDKKLLNIEKVSDFIEAMDSLIKVL